jgi:hypothetical protein
LAIMHLKNQSQKSAVIRLLSGFPVLLAFLTAHVRTNPRNLLTCGFAVFVTIDERNTAIMNPAGQPKAHQVQCGCDREPQEDAEMELRYALVQSPDLFRSGRTIDRPGEHCRCRIRLQKSATGCHSSLRAGPTLTCIFHSPVRLHDPCRLRRFES